MPFITASPSFGPSVIGVNDASAKATSALVIRRLPVLRLPAQTVVAGFP